MGDKIVLKINDTVAEELIEYACSNCTIKCKDYSSEICFYAALHKTVIEARQKGDKNE